MKVYLVLSFLLALVLVTSRSEAQHPIDIQKMTAAGKYYEALSLFEQLPERKVTIEALEAAARSAWGLSLLDRASTYIDRILLDETLSGERRAKSLFMRAMIELHADKPRVAILFADRAKALIQSPTELRGSILMLLGDAHISLAQLGPAKANYSDAFEEVSEELIAEVAFRLAEVERKLGNLEEATDFYRKVPVSHERAPEAMRALSEVSLQAKDYTGVQLWLTKGRELYPDHFLDSWVEYALARSAFEMDDLRTLQKIREAATEKYPTSDSWITLLHALAEKAEWNILLQN
ncbi:MAG: tetratricopeptide repeat protein [Bdellovibrionota bacterium]|jgi:tetratricopeptide (TPR) repeat protein